MTGSTVPLPFRIIAALALVILLLPVVIVVLSGLNAGEYLTFPPKGLSLRWIAAFLTSPIFMPAYGFSFALAFGATLISTLLGTMASVFLTRSLSRWAGVLRGVFMLPIVLPGLVLGLALYVFYATTDLGLSRSVTGLLIGHVLVTCPFVIVTVSAALVGFDLSLEEAARSLGASALGAFLRITLPIIAPAISAGSIFAFIISFGQFDVNLFLSIPDLQPLPLAMYASLRYAFEPTAAAAGIFAIALVALSTIATSRLVSFKRMFGA